MNATASERDRVSRSAKGKREKKNIGVRRHEMLIVALGLYKATTGTELNLTRLSEKYGRSVSAATQYVSGHQRLNIEWMLIFSLELGRAPQDIFGSDWPFPELTVSPIFGRLWMAWQALEPTEQAMVLKYIDGAALKVGRPKS
jgi:hypothetical protein